MPTDAKTLSLFTTAFMLSLAGCSHGNAAPQYTSTTDEPTNIVNDAQSPAPTTEPPADSPQRLLTPEELEGLTWRCIGPANMGGRVADIAIAPANPKTFYVGFGTGGIFKTTNGGTTFTPVFDTYETASIGSIVVADAPPDWPGWDADVDQTARKEQGKAKVIWVGTGEGNGRNSSSYGNGVYRSTDAGGSFENIGLTDSHDIPRLAVDPRNPDLCYAAALGHLWGPNEQRGVYKTTDGGKTWTAILHTNENTGACDVILDPQNPDTIYAAMYTRRRSPWSFQSGGLDGGIYRSTDAGATWTKLTSGLPAQTGRIGLDIYPPDPRILYAIVESDVGGWGTGPFDDYSKEGGLFRSDDRGDTWTRVHDYNPRAFYFSKVRVDPTDDQRVYLLGWGLYISDDGGKTLRAGGARKPHVDLHAMVINPADTDHLLLGTDGGVYISYDRAATWDFLNHLAVGEFYNVAVDMSDPYRVGGGLQDNGSWIGPSATIKDTGGDDPGDPGGGITNQDWTFVHWGDGFHLAFDPLDDNIVYAESQDGHLARVHFDTGLRKALRPSAKEGQPNLRFNWNAPFFISPHNPTTLYFGGNCVFKLLDRGDRWQQISDDLSHRDVDRIMSAGSTAENYGTITALAESPLTAGMLWAGTDDGRIHLTRDDGQTWTDVTPAEVSGRYISKIEPSHHAADTAFVAIDGHRCDDMDPHLLATDDGGQAWRSITGDLPGGAHAKVIREDINNPEVLYLGTERAAFVSIDRGQHWAKLNGKSLPTVAVDDLVQHPRETDLVAGTHGRSIYILDDASPLSQLTPAIVASEFHLFDVRPATPRLFLPYAGFWTDRVFKAPNPPMGAKITYWVRDANSGNTGARAKAGRRSDGDSVSITIKNQRGTLIRNLTGPAKQGLNRIIWDLQREEHDRLPIPILGQKEFVPPRHLRGNRNPRRPHGNQDNRGPARHMGTATVAPARHGRVGRGQTRDRSKARGLSKNSIISRCSW